MGMPVINPSDITREEAVGNLLESIAMEESAIAHILNAESEKINKVVSNPNSTVEDLLAANKSVKRTIDAIVRMESVLQAKLSVFESMICE